jgi:uncharacterized protein with PQ loop repeat
MNVWGKDMEIKLQLLAGTISTVLFAVSVLPMLFKAKRTKDMKSYSFSNLLINNIANIIHSFYVFSLPVGPIWLLHSFYLVATALQLAWYLRYEQWGLGVKAAGQAR